MLDNPSVQPRKLSDHTCRLIHTGGGQLYVERNNDPTHRCWPVSKIPKCLINFVRQLGNMFYDKQNRCLSVLLQLDPERCHWSFMLPPQKCSPTHSSWTLKATDLDDLPHDEVIAGSIQIIAGGEEFPQIEEMCRFDGIHFVLRLGDSTSHFVMLIVAGGKPIRFRISAVVHDHIEAAIKQALPDLTGPLAEGDQQPS